MLSGGSCPGGFWFGGILTGGILSRGDFVRGDIVPGGFCPRTHKYTTYLGIIFYYIFHTLSSR